MFEGDVEDLKQTKVTQPAIFLHSVLLAKTLKDFAPDMVLPVLLCIGLSAAVILSYPWYSFAGLCVIYLASIPVAAGRYRHHKHRTAEARQTTLDVSPK